MNVWSRYYKIITISPVITAMLSSKVDPKERCFKVHTSSLHMDMYVSPYVLQLVLRNR